MSHNRLVLTLAVSIGLLGCTVRPLPTATLGGANAPTSSAPDGVAGDRAAAPVSRYGTLVLNVRWPEPQAGYHTALIPDTTAALLVTVASGSTEVGRQTVIRQAGEATASLTLQLKADNNLSVRVRAYRESAPDPATDTPIAENSAVVNIEPSRNTAANISLTPLYVPTVTGLSSNVGTVDDTVTLSGTNFGSGAVPVLVYFNGVLTVGSTRNSDTSITVKVPPGATTGRVVVKADGVSSTSDAVFWVANRVQISSPKAPWDPSPLTERLVRFGESLPFNANPTWAFKIGEGPFTYGTPPAPTWVNLNPSAGSIDADGVFTATASYAATGVLARLGSVESATQSIRLVADQPLITDLLPPNGGLSANYAGGKQTVVDVIGSGFGDRPNSTLHVFLGAVEMTGVTRVNDRRLTFTLPSSGVGTGQLKVVSYGVTSTSQPTFQVLSTLAMDPTGTVNLALGATRSFTVTATDTQSSAVASPSVTWTSSSTGSVVISSDGVATAVGYGHSVISAYSGGLLPNMGMGADVYVNYDYSITSGGGISSFTRGPHATDRLYAQSFALPQGTTLKAIDAPLIRADNDSALVVQIRSDAAGLPGALLSEATWSRNAELPGHIYVHPDGLQLAAGTYHMVFKIPASTTYYYYEAASGSGTGSAALSTDGGTTWTANPQLFFRLGQ